MNKLLAALSSVILLGACQTASKPPIASLTGTESGSVSFQSSTPYDFVDAIDGSAPSAVVSGSLRFPEGASADQPVAAVVISHGSGGVGRQTTEFSGMLLKEGYATFVVDSYGPRGVAKTVKDQSRVSSQSMLADAFAALRLLSSDPRIDADRIGLLGFSKGGIVALYSGFEQIRGWYAEGSEKFAAHAAYYPFCGSTIPDLTLTGAPSLMLLGEQDNYTPAAPCLTLQEKADPANVTLRSVVYEGAQHGFDTTSPVGVFNYFNPSDCILEVSDGGVTSLSDGTPASTLSERRAALVKCGRTGVRYGGNPGARAQSSEELKAFFRGTIGIETAGQS